jgi:ABC-type Fe3+/spermidine/putrescine transport system ATPase subunit
MDAGCIRQAGAPLEVYRQPKSRFVAEFLGESNLLEGRVEGEGIATRAGLFRGAAGFAAGAVVLLSIRPEAWRLGPLQAPVNSFPGRILETILLGEIARHRVALDSGVELLVFELNPRPRNATQIYATVDREDVVAILES